jgi:hypothetical protein
MRRTKTKNEFEGFEDMGCLDERQVAKNYFNRAVVLGSRRRLKRVESDAHRSRKG